MKTKNLIKLLSQYDPEADVVLHDFTGEPVMFVCKSKPFPNVVRLQTETDVDMKEELLERFKLIDNFEDKSLYENIEAFKNAKSKEEVEKMVYETNIFQGITPDTIEKYLDKEHADMMRKFCEEHDLKY